MPDLILASTSPYRRELLGRLGVPFDVRHSNVDETARKGERAPDLACRLALAKAEGARSGSGHDAEVIIGADQVASRHGVLLRKPGDHATALEQLRACQGQTVLFHTATTVIATATGERRDSLEETVVEFQSLRDEQLSRYLDIEQPYDCAGGFKAEGLGICLFRAIRSGDPTALLGLPMIWLSQTLRDLGFDPLASSER
ncbi:MAG TPA: Maf family nucleotide pyrophosphatase [Gammaproteobacteria bacterium]